ncbi:tripartite tricarboxylate transporter substrate binding protein [Acetobacteraceae bacterium H6797]|nr:tripartite tricarboxylate transporter substrate binding protein [Acetobacteraceae bacterium H6797]
MKKTFGQNPAGRRPLLAGIGALAAASLSLARPALAQPAWPARPIRLVVPWTAGGGVDTINRRMGQKLSLALGQAVVIDNRGGATGTIGANEAAHQAPDGYTLFAMDNSYATLPYLFSKLPFDYANSFTPISISAFAPMFLGVARKSPYRDLAALIAAAKREPEKITYGTGGNGSAPHFATMAFEKAAGIKLFHVPFRGANEAVVGVLSGNVDMVMISIGSAAGSLASGDIRPLAICGEKRIAAFPDLPTFAEAGLPGYDVSSWYGIAAIKGTPEPIIARIHTEMQAALAAPDMKDFLASLGAVPGGMPPAAFADLLRRETERWRSIAESGGIERQ